jgi:hypothetical protein
MMKEQKAKDAAKAIELGELPPPKKIPNTIENTRERDVTTVEAGDEEVEEDEAQDEFADHFNGLVQPKVMVPAHGQVETELHFSSGLCVGERVQAKVSFALPCSLLHGLTRARLRLCRYC